MGDEVWFDNEEGMMPGCQFEDDLRRLRQIDQLDSDAREVLNAMRAPFTAVSPEEIERQAERITREIRAGNRAKQE